MLCKNGRSENEQISQDIWAGIISLSTLTYQPKGRYFTSVVISRMKNCLFKWPYWKSWDIYIFFFLSMLEVSLSRGYFTDEVKNLKAWRNNLNRRLSGIRINSINFNYAYSFPSLFLAIRWVTLQTTSFLYSAHSLMNNSVRCGHKRYAITITQSLSKYPLRSFDAGLCLLSTAFCKRLAQNCIQAMNRYLYH